MLIFMDWLYFISELDSVFKEINLANRSAIVRAQLTAIHPD